MAKMKGLLLLFVLSWYLPTQAIGSKARELVELKDASQLAAPAASSVVLPTNKYASLEQLDSNLCWAFSFLSSVESTYLAAHPASSLVLSRGFLQNYQWQERFQRWADLGIFYLKESGTADDAFRMLKTYGIVQSKEYKSYATRIEQYTKKKTSSANGEPIAFDKEEIQKLQLNVFEFYFPLDLPKSSKFESQELSPLQLAEKVLDGKIWKTYAVSTDGTEKIGEHYDSDASPGLKVQYLLREKIQKMILGSLNSKIAVYVSFSGDGWGHSLSLYGVDFDKENRPIRFYMKDTYADYFFIADPELVMKNFRAITTAL